MQPVPDEELNSPGEAEAPPEEDSPRTFATRHTIPRARAASVDRMLAEELTVNGYLKVKAAA